MGLQIACVSIRWHVSRLCIVFSVRTLCVGIQRLGQAGPLYNKTKPLGGESLV